MVGVSHSYTMMKEMTQSRDKQRQRRGRRRRRVVLPRTRTGLSLSPPRVQQRMPGTLGMCVCICVRACASVCVCLCVCVKGGAGGITEQGDVPKAKKRKTEKEGLCLPRTRTGLSLSPPRVQQRMPGTLGIRVCVCMYACAYLFNPNPYHIRFLFEGRTRMRRIDSIGSHAWSEKLS